MIPSFILVLSKYNYTNKIYNIHQIHQLASFYKKDKKVVHTDIHKVMNSIKKFDENCYKCTSIKVMKVKIMML
jgi:hypothetical protein